MKKIHLFIAFLFPLLVSGQSADGVTRRKTRIGLLFSPDFSYRFLNFHSSNKMVEDIRNGEETARFGYTTGVSYKKGLTNKLQIETGVLYSAKGFQTKNTAVEWATTSPEYPVRSRTRYTFDYFEIPVKLNYHLGMQRIRCFVAAGVAMSLFIQKRTKVIAQFADGHVDSRSSTVNIGYSRFNTTVMAGFGVSYDLTEQLTTSVEPTYRQFITSIVVDDKAREYAYALGVNAGIYYTFAKRK